MFRFNSDPILLNMTSYIKKESGVMLRDIQGVFFTLAVCSDLAGN